MSSRAQTSPSKQIIPPQPSSPMSPLPISIRSSPMSPAPISMSSSQPTVDLPKIPRKYPRLRLEVSLPHPSSRRRTLAPKEAATRTDEEGSQPRQLNKGGELLEKGWNDGWPGQWNAEKGVGTAPSLPSAVDGLRLDTRRPPNNVGLEILDGSPPQLSMSQEQLRNHGGSGKGEMAGPCMEMELEVEVEVGVDGCRALPIKSTSSTPQHDQHPTPTPRLSMIRNTTNVLRQLHHPHHHPCPPPYHLVLDLPARSNLSLPTQICPLQGPMTSSKRGTASSRMNLGEA
jgi:hypothetical protein